MSGPVGTTVLVNLLWLVPGVVGGSEESTTDALRAVAESAETDVALRLAVLSPFVDAHPDLVDSFRCDVLDIDGRNKVRRVLAEQTWLPALTTRVGASVVHHAGGVVPLRHPGAVVLTIHDLQPLDMPRNFSRAKRSYLAAMIGRSARAAAVICVPSEFTRSRVVDVLGVPPERVVVVPWWPRPAPEVDHDGARPAVVPDGRYLLYPAITYAHKNHLMLLDAFAEVAAHDPTVSLVLTGGIGPLEAAVRRRIDDRGLGGRVVRTGRVPPEQLEHLYARASAVVIPSRYEGFGLPALEAAVRSCPVVASTAGSLPEVVGGGPLVDPADVLVDPDDVTGWTAAMQAVLALSPEARAARIDAALARTSEFGPRRTAAALLEAYRRAAGGRAQDVPLAGNDTAG